MRGDDIPVGRPPAPARTTLWILGATLLLTGLVILVGVALVALVGQRGDDSTWARWSNVGEAFGAVNSVMSALAVVALVITWALQSRELRAQRAELATQRGLLESAETVLRRSADVEVRKLHVTLIRMAVDNPHLADVWPSPAAADQVTGAQHMYSNLLVQHLWLEYTTGSVTREELINNLRFLFVSPKVRAFWRDTAASRHSIYVEGTTEAGLTALADEICREYEAVLACTDDAPARRRAGRPPMSGNPPTASGHAGDAEPTTAA